MSLVSVQKYIKNNVSGFNLNPSTLATGLGVIVDGIRKASEASSMKECF